MAPVSSFQKGLAALILLVIIFFGLFRLTQSPPFSFDEGWVVQVATNIYHLGMDGLQFSPGHIQHVSVLTSVGYPLIYAEAFWFKLFGAGIFQARLMMVFYMLGLVAVSFLLVKRLHGNTAALSALAILATFPPFYSFGKTVVGEVPMLFFLALFLLCFNLAMNNPEKKRFWLILAGISAGLCIVTKTMALAFVPVLFIAAILAWRSKLVTWKDIGIVVMSAVIPIAVWVATNFQPGDTLASVMDYYSNPSALTDKAGTAWLNLRMLFTRIGSLYTLSVLAVWIVGVIVRFKAGIKIRLEESIALIFSVLLVFSLLFRYMDARYLFPIQVLGILFFPYSLSCIFKKPKAYSAIIIALSLAGLYQLSFRSYIADSYKSTYMQDLTAYFDAVPATTTVFFYNAPNMVPLFHGRNYYQRIAMFEKWILGSEFAPIAKAGSADMLVVSGQMSLADQRVPLDKYVKTAEFQKILIYKKKAPITPAYGTI